MNWGRLDLPMYKGVDASTLARGSPSGLHWSGPGRTTPSIWSGEWPGVPRTDIKVLINSIHIYSNLL